MIKDAILIRQTKALPNDQILARDLAELGGLTWTAGDAKQARTLYDQAVVIASASGQATPQLAAILAGYASVAFDYNDPRSLELANRSAQINQQLYGSSSFEHSQNENEFGKIYFGLGKYGLAEQHFRSALSELQVWSGTDIGFTAHYLVGLASALIMERRFSEAKKYLLRSLAITTKKETASTIAEGEAKFYLGFIALQQGDLKQAEDYFESVIGLAHDHAAEEMFVEYSELGTAQICAIKGDDQRAEVIIRKVLTTTKLNPGYVVLAGNTLLGHVLLHEGKPAAAEAALRPAYEWFAHDAIRPHTAMAYQDLAEAERRLGKPQEAARIAAEFRAREK